jgi:AcrR family transcriptional regulator
VTGLPTAALSWTLAAACSASSAPRARILEAARSLFAERGVREVSLEEVARAAGVGKATLFRRFGDGGALFLALLDEHERELQDEVLRGEPPLGPGAPPSADPDLLAHLLLAAFDAELLTALQEQGRDEATVRDAIRAVVEAVLH